MYNAAGSKQFIIVFGCIYGSLIRVQHCSVFWMLFLKFYKAVQAADISMEISMAYVL